MLNTLIVSNILLWVVVILMATVILALLRQVGVLYERVAPAGALAINKQLQAGADAPAIAVNDLAGNAFTLGGKPADGRSRLLFFMSPDCPVCKTLLPAVLSAASAEKSWLDLVFASDGLPEEHQHFVDKYGLQDFQYVVSELLGKSYGISKLPYGVLIDEQGQVAAFGIVNSREHLDSLFEAKERKLASIQDYMQAKQQDAPIFTEITYNADGSS